ncbi:TRC40/GET3/ArsA family transport-energizing ATPase [Halorarum halophilum]|uniref:TRC40/GET3/ArsA family transport-energizing ATPase n=1 Tax=Halorarum halophilum TaxID=2743090 RepID=A0A7D5GCY3_9EURY|nr:TRC40/GET3/ArsA family transport-energizing ATPase [Halobaculum halophilum]QLG28592.1 TRC40/GET3/ArsA family transport-energizing ATPase [Halobaculum halophilum]
MNDIDVEPVNDVDEDVGGNRPPADPAGMGTTVDTADLAERSAPEYVLYGGKGGVGKTTCAAATALASAAGGTSTLVVSTDPAHSLSDTLDTEILSRPSRIREDVPLYAAEIDPDAAMEDGLFGDEGMGAEDDGARAGAGGTDAAGGNPLGGLGGMGEAMEDGPMGAMLGGTMPGADEAAAMRQLLEHLDDPRFDRVVVDTAPTGHTLRLLQLPELLDSMVGRLMKLRQQFSGMMEGVKGMFGMGEGGPGEPDLDELKDRIERLRTVLQDPDRTDFRVVMVPEEMSVMESERLVERLDEFDIPVSTLVVNRVMEDPGDVAGAAVDDDWVVTPNLDTCEFCQRRWEVQQNSLSRATELFRGRDVKRVPLLADEVRGEDALRVVAACLA